MNELQALRLLPSEHNKALPVHWRWERARWLREHAKNAKKADEDPWVKLCCKFQAEQEKAVGYAATERLMRKYPALFWAWYWYTQEDARTRWMVEAYLCAGEKPARIADITCLTPQTVGVYSTLFFDVLGKRRHWGYLLNVVFHKSIHAGLHERDYDLLWKLYGLLCGPKMLDLILRVENMMDVNSTEGAKAARHALVSGQMANKMLMSTATIPASFNHEAIFIGYNKLKELETGEDSAGQAQQAITAGINAMIQSFGFKVGAPTRTSPEQGIFDNTAAEPRAAELFGAALGFKPDTLKDVTGLKFPEAVNDSHRQGS